MSNVITFNGVRFRRYPNAKQVCDRVYYTPGIADRQRGIKRLHEEVWKAAHGPIPDGCHIHHKDHDPLNNNPENLECLTAEQHRRHHGDDHASRACTAAWLAHLDAIRPLAAAWHRTEEGRTWHADHARDQWEQREPTERPCDRCGHAYNTRSRKGDERFCSARCRTAARRASGADRVERKCERCGNPFQTDRYSRTRFCGRQCAARHQHEERET